MGKMSRTKGQQGERELIKVMVKCGLPAVSRRLQQYQVSGETDLKLGHLAIEVKRHKQILQGDADRFWIEACEQAEAHEIPVLAYRSDRQQWRIRVPITWVQFGMMDATMGQRSGRWVEMRVTEFAYLADMTGESERERG